MSGSYYVPNLSKWPLVAACGLGSLALGAASWFQGMTIGPYAVAFGLAVIVYMMLGWFGAVINESQSGLYSKQTDRSFRWGMFWFIFSEVMFFSVFFGALFYARNIAVPDLSADQLLWPGFQAQWPLLNNPDPAKFPNPNAAMPALWLPLINTFVLIASSVTITYAHHALLVNNRQKLNLLLLATIVLGVGFLCLQAYEYHHAYTDLGLKLSTGIYGTTFFMLTGFHGMHVTIGSIILAMILLRCWRGDFDPQHNFGFEAAAWYWHFVDVVWLCLFVYVYVLPIR